MKKLKIYLAGPLFSTAEQDYNRFLAGILRSRGFDVFLPQEHEQNHIPGQTRLIFDGDVEGLDWADIVVAVLDGADVDSGTAWEVGYAYAKEKKIYGIKSDFRTLGPEGACNLMIEQALSARLARTTTDLLIQLPMVGEIVEEEDNHVFTG